ncbi:hypothetical protein GTR00_20940, partial [Kineococcus sp. T90]
MRSPFAATGERPGGDGKSAYGESAYGESAYGESAYDGTRFDESPFGEARVEEFRPGGSRSGEDGFGEDGPGEDGYRWEVHEREVHERDGWRALPLQGGTPVPRAHQAPHEAAVLEALAAGVSHPDLLARLVLRSATLAGEDLEGAGAGGEVSSEDWTSVRDGLVLPLLAQVVPTAPVPPAGPLWLPGAERVGNARSAGGGYLPSPWRVVFHTVEAEDGMERFRTRAAEHRNPPHLWAMPSADLVLQTVPLDRSAYALARPGALHTNRLHAVQVELWGFAAKTGETPPEVLEWLARRVLAPVARLVPLDLREVRPTAGVTAYGVRSATRMSPREWEGFGGVCGHQHVPDNSHWDPGRLDLAAIAGRARALLGAGPAAGADELSLDHDGPGFAAEAEDEAAPALPPGAGPAPEEEFGRTGPWDTAEDLAPPYP